LPPPASSASNPSPRFGAPKPIRIEILDRLAHATQRGAYSGILGFIAVNGCTKMRFFIRTVLIYNNCMSLLLSVQIHPPPKTDAYVPLSCADISVGAGGAITSLLKKENQWREVRLKDDTVQRSLNLHSKLQQQQQPWQLQLQQQQHLQQQHQTQSNSLFDSRPPLKVVGITPCMVPADFNAA
jgi:hypothetical protein